MGASDEWKIYVWTDDPIECTAILTGGEALRLSAHSDVELVEPRDD